MDKSRLAKIILDEDPADWPEEISNFKIETKKAPDLTKARISRMISQAVEESEEEQKLESTADEKIVAIGGHEPKKPFGLKLAIAALIPVAVAISAFFLFPRDRAFLELTRLEGNYTAEKSGNKVSLKPNSKLEEGLSLKLAESGSFNFNFKNIANLRVDGPARFELKTIRAGEKPTLLMFLHEGVVSVQSNHKGPKNIIWQTPGLTFTMTGTVGRLSVGKNSQVIEVLEGKFRVKGQEKSRTINAGEKLIVPTPIPQDAKFPPNAKLEQEEQKALESLKKHLSNPSLPYIKRVPFKPNKKFATLNQIRKFYGVVHEVTLEDFRSYQGHMKTKGNRIRIHTTYGLIDLPKNAVKEIKQIK